MKRGGFVKEFIFFILGVVSVLFLLPICSQLLELITLWIEALKVHPSKRILKYQADATAMREFIKPAEPTPDYEMEYIYGDDEDFGDDDHEE
jgi:hypothetical protein